MTAALQSSWKTISVALKSVDDDDDDDDDDDEALASIIIGPRDSVNCVCLKTASSSGSPTLMFCLRTPRVPCYTIFSAHLNSAVFERFYSRIDTVSVTETLKIICVALQELTVTCNVSGVNRLVNNYPVTKLDRYNKYQTKQ